jgi:hypothetical protein
MMLLLVKLLLTPASTDAHEATISTSLSNESSTNDANNASDASDARIS